MVEFHFWMVAVHPRSPKSGITWVTWVTSVTCDPLGPPLSPAFREFYGNPLGLHGLEKLGENWNRQGWWAAHGSMNDVLNLSVHNILSSYPPGWIEFSSKSTLKLTSKKQTENGFTTTLILAA